jgi:hypothetical protein
MMARCEDFPCCGHEPGCCPDYDESGRQLNMKCVCGATVPLRSKSSLCSSCLNAPDPNDPYGDEFYEDDGGDWDDEPGERC